MNKATTSIVVKTQFEGKHQYVDAPPAVEYLKNIHRHLFYVEVEMEVSHDDRELEFILVKNTINKYIESHPFSIIASCEQMADLICRHLIEVYGERAMKCCVYEDGENGGCVYYEL